MDQKISHLEQKVLEFSNKGKYKQLADILAYSKICQKKLNQALQNALYNYLPNDDYYQVIQILIQKGAYQGYSNLKEISCLMLACKTGSLALIEQFIPHSNINQKDHTGRTALQYSTMNQKEDQHLILVKLLQKGAYIDNQDMKGNTALHYCIMQKNIWSIVCLISMGASITIQNNSGMSPQNLARQSNSMQIKQLVLNQEQQQTDQNLLLCYQCSNLRQHLICQQCVQETYQQDLWLRQNYKIVCQKLQNSQDLNKDLEQQLQKKEDKTKDYNLLKKLYNKSQKEVQQLNQINQKLRQQGSQQKINFLEIPQNGLANQNFLIKSLQNDLDSFNAELKIWQNKVAPVYKNLISRIENDIAQISDDIRLQVYGSFATGLYQPSSDIDLVIINAPQEILSPIETILKQITEIQQIQVIRSAFIPVIKAEFLMQNFIIKIDLSIQNQDHRGLQCKEFVQRMLNYYKGLKDLVLILKLLLNYNNFNETFKGGLSSYGAFLLALSYCQQLDWNLCITSPTLIIGFFNYYGRMFNYSTAISVYDPEIEQPLASLNLETPQLVILDPMNPQNNVAHKTDFQYFLNILSNACSNLWKRPICKCPTSSSPLVRIFYDSVLMQNYQQFQQKMIESAPAWSMPGRKAYQAKSDVPGPGTYESKDSRFKGPSIRLGLSARETLRTSQNQVGPGSYEIQGGLSKTGGQIGRQARLNKSQKIEVPGPGSYKIPSQLDKKSWSMTPRRSDVFASKADSPGPNTYNPKLYMSTIESPRNYSIGKSQRGQLSDRKDSPGPGQYEAKVTRVPSVVFGRAQREGNRRGSESPGPGNYNHHQNFDGPKFSLTGRWKTLTKQNNPGPGMYETRSSFDYTLNTIIGRDQRKGFYNEKLNRSMPGPGQYDTRKDLGGFKYKFGNEKRQKKLKFDGPGPGAYNLPTAISNIPSYAKKS